MAGTKLRIGLGTSDFRAFRNRGAYFVDKSLLIRDVIDANAEVLLIPRPRRFGKTLNLTMLRDFFDIRGEDATALFSGLAIENEPQALAHRSAHPVIFLSFKDVKAPSWDLCFDAIRGVLSRAFGEHRDLLASNVVAEHERAQLEAILAGRSSEPEAWQALADLSRWLQSYHRAPVVILIDEYDTPIHAGWTYKYYDRVVTFFRNFLSGGLKDNPSLFKGVLAGILHVAKESIFSGLNNLSVYSILRPELSGYFGFTEDEVIRFGKAAGLPSALGEIRRWYDGYSFAGTRIYNPWSVISIFDSEDGMPRPYWMSTSDNELIRRLLIGDGAGPQPEIETLLQGGLVERRIDENLVLRDLEHDPDALWSLLLFSGYLTARSVESTERGLLAKLGVPNEEVRRAFSALAYDWLRTKLGGSAELTKLLAALLAGEERAIERYLSTLVSTTLSYHDTAGAQPERVFHGFVAGLLVSLSDTHEVRSNRESGFGRYDLMLIPKRASDPGVVLELKSLDQNRNEPVDRALDDALKQIRERAYATELVARSASPIHELAIVLDGKRVHVRRA